MSAKIRNQRLTLLLRVAIAAAMIGVVAMAVATPLGAKDASKVTTFLGRFHILALHVPIGVLVLAVTAEATTFLRRGRRYGDVVVGFALPLLVATGFAAVLLGLFLAHGGHYPHKLVAPHRNLTVIGIVLAGVAALRWSQRRAAGRWIHRGILGASALSMMIGAHFGGSMTHGEDYLTVPFHDVMPDEPADAGDPDAGSAEVDTILDASVPRDAGSDSGAVPEAPSASVSASASVEKPKPTNKQLAQALVNRRCAPCHTSLQKGGLRLTDISKPTKKGVFVAGSPGSSSMYTNLLLPKDDDDHMPPEDKVQLTAGEIAIIRNFIAEPTK